MYSIHCFLFILLSVACHVRADDDRPNILLLLTDDQDVVLGSFDHMPHLKTHLQDQGVTFENAFVHTPICCPSRSQILTGRYTHHGVAHNNSKSGNCYGEKWIQDIETNHTYGKRPIATKDSLNISEPTTALVYVSHSCKGGWISHRVCWQVSQCLWIW